MRLTITVSAAGRLGGLSRSLKKIEAAKKNIALARTIAGQTPSKKIAARKNIELARRRLAVLRGLKNNT